MSGSRGLVSLGWKSWIPRSSHHDAFTVLWYLQSHLRSALFLRQVGLLLFTNVTEWSSKEWFPASIQVKSSALNRTGQHPRSKQARPTGQRHCWASEGDRSPLLLPSSQRGFKVQVTPQTTRRQGHGEKRPSSLSQRVRGQLNQSDPA